MTGAPDYQAPVPMTANEAVLVRKTARDTGFDVPGEPDAVWLPVHSTHAPVRVWIARVNMNGYAIAMSMHSVAVTVALERPLVADPGHLPLGAVDTIVVTGGAELRERLLGAAPRVGVVDRDLRAGEAEALRRRAAEAGG